MALVHAVWLAGLELLVVLETDLAVLVNVVLEEPPLEGKVTFETRDCPGVPLVVLVIAIVEVADSVTVAVEVATVEVATVVVEAAVSAGANEANGVEPRPPETVTTARARRIPAASPIPKRFPSIIVYPSWAGR